MLEQIKVSQRVYRVEGLLADLRQTSLFPSGPQPVISISRVNGADAVLTKAWDDGYTPALEDLLHPRCHRSIKGVDF